MKRRWLLLTLLVLTPIAAAIPLSTLGSFKSLSSEFQNNVLHAALVARCAGTNNLCVVEIDQATGGIPTGASGGRSFATSVHNAYATTNVTTGAWVQLIASTAAAVNELYLFDSCGQVLELGTGAAAAETRVALIPPGGIESPFALRIAAGTRVSVRAVSGNCTLGNLVITGLN